MFPEYYTFSHPLGMTKYEPTHMKTFAAITFLFLQFTICSITVVAKNIRSRSRT